MSCRVLNIEYTRSNRPAPRDQTVEVSKLLQMWSDVGSALARAPGEGRTFRLNDEIARTDGSRESALPTSESTIMLLQPFGEWAIIIECRPEPPRFFVAYPEMWIRRVGREKLRAIRV